MSELLSIGINHHSAPLALRERVAFSVAQLQPALLALKTAFLGELSEAAMLSTCNRSEIYAVGSPTLAAQLPRWLADFRQMPLADLAPHCVSLAQHDTVRHLFRVASGLDSMVLGEPQILGQLKQSVQVAEKAGMLGALLHPLFQRSFAAAKAVRTHTRLGAESVSMAAAAVRVVERVFGDLTNTRVLLIGAGDMMQLCATHFAAQRPQTLMVANRSVAGAQLLAQRVNGEAMRLADLPGVLPQYDVVVSSTASSLPILGLGLVARAIKARRHRPMVMIDLAVPRDIEAEVAELDDVYLYTVDDLGRIVQSGHDTRRGAVTQAEAIIERQVGSFMQWLNKRAVVPVIRQLQHGMAQLLNEETQRAQQALARGVDPAVVLQRLSHQLNQKLLHAPLSELHQADARAQQQLLSWLPRLLPFPDESS